MLGTVWGATFSTMKASEEQIRVRRVTKCRRENARLEVLELVTLDESCPYHTCMGAQPHPFPFSALCFVFRRTNTIEEYTPTCSKTAIAT